MNTSSSKLIPYLALWTFFLMVIPSLFLVTYIGEINCTLIAFSFNALTLLIGSYLLSFGFPFTYAILMYKNYIALIVCWYALFLVLYGKFYKIYGLHYIEIIS